MNHLNDVISLDEEIELIIEEMSERAEMNCTGYTGCKVNGCSIDDTGYLSDVLP